jgi:hypothetical protein
MGPVNALGISAKVAKRLMRGWTSRKHKEYWQTTHWQRQAKGFLKRPSAARAVELHSLSRTQPVILMGLLTGHSKKYII